MDVIVSKWFRSRWDK